MIKAALIGTISRTWVNCSSLRARANVDKSEPHQIAREIAPSIEKTRSGDNLEVDARFVVSCKMHPFARVVRSASGRTVSP